MNTQSKVLIILLVCPFFLFFSSVEEDSHGSPMVGYIGKILNFLVLFGALGFMIRKPLLSFLEGRRKEIDSTIKDVKEIRSETEKQYQASLKRLEKLKAELEDIMNQAEEAGQQRNEAILQAAEKESERIKNFARLEIDLFYKTKVRELKAYTAKLAASLAETNIKAKMTPEKQSFFIDQSIDKLEEFYD